MQNRYSLPQNESSKEAKRRKVSPQDMAELQHRAQEWANLGGVGRSGLARQAKAAYELYLDVLRTGQVGDFPRWLSRHSGMAYETCRRKLKAGQALAAQVKPNRNQSGLLAELRERETTPVEFQDWNQDE